MQESKYLLNKQSTQKSSIYTLLQCPGKLIRHLNLIQKKYGAISIAAFVDESAINWILCDKDYMIESILDFIPPSSFFEKNGIEKTAAPEIDTVKYKHTLKLEMFYDTNEEFFQDYIECCLNYWSNPEDLKHQFNRMMANVLKKRYKQAISDASVKAILK